PDAPFAARYEAVSNEVAWQNETTLLPAAMCAELKPEERSHCQQQQSAEQRAKCIVTTADEATCAWFDGTLFFFSSEAGQRGRVQEVCRCLELDVDGWDAAIRDGEERAALAIARRRDRIAYLAACSQGNARPCWWWLRELGGYPVDGPAVTAWTKRRT